MKRLLLLLFMGVLVSTGTFAQPINLLVEEEQYFLPETEKGLLTQDILDELNNNIYVNALIEDYNSIGVKIEDTLYVIEIKDNKINNIILGDNFSVVDYTIETNFIEMLYIFSNHNKMNKIDMLRTLVLDKDIPIKIVFRMAGILIKG